MRGEKLLGKNLYEKLLHLKRAPGLPEQGEGEWKREQREEEGALCVQHLAKARETRQKETRQFL